MKITNDTILAYVNGNTLEVVDDGILAVGKADINELLNANVRAEPQYGADATHVTNTTRKYQCNAALRYEDAIAKLRTKHDLARDGAAIRMILEAGLRALGFGKMVDEVQAEAELDAE